MFSLCYFLKINVKCYADLSCLQTKTSVFVVLFSKKQCKGLCRFMNFVVSVVQCLQTSGYIFVRLKVYVAFVKILSEGQALRKILLNSSYKYVRLFEEWQGVSTFSNFF